MTPDQQKMLKAVLTSLADRRAEGFEAITSSRLAVNYGLPPLVARFFLEYENERGNLSRVDLADTFKEEDVSSLGYLLDPQEVELLRLYHGPMEIYLTLPAFGYAGRVVPPFLVQFAFMIGIYTQVLFRDRARLRYVFQPVVQVLRQPRNQWNWQLGQDLNQLGPEGAVWKEELGQRLPFEGFYCDTSTQLLLLTHLAMLVMEGNQHPSPLSFADLWHVPGEARQEGYARLGRLLVQGIESSPALRAGGWVRYVVGSDELIPTVTEPDNGIEVWWQWLIERMAAADEAERQLCLKLAVYTLRELGSRHCSREAVLEMAERIGLDSLQVQNIRLGRRIREAAGSAWLE